MSNMLHIVSTNTGHEVLFERIAQGDTLLFTGPAVLNLHKKAALAKIILAQCQRFQLYALDVDLLARGLTVEEILPAIKVIDYPGFVSLTVEHAVIKTWN